MKKLLFILLTMIVAISVNAQTVINGDARGSVGGAAADTLIASGTLAYTFRIQSPVVMDLQFLLKVARVSGTVTNNWVWYGSMDNTNWISTGDTIKNVGATGTTYLPKNLDDFNWSYLKVASTAPATAQKASYKLFYSIRQE